LGIKETLKYIHNIKWQGSKPGLTRTQELLKALGNPEKNLKFVHVAGTNGKGSTSVCIASVLTKAGYKTGLFISPYVLRFNERIQVDGRFISDTELELLVDEIRPFADVMDDSPTEFEIITALAMLYFLRKKCDIVVLEVGMGGRMDSTNVIETPELAVITSIGYDHVKELGPALRDIAGEKAGIIKPGGDVLIYDDVESVFERVSAERNARLYKVDFSRITKQDFSLDCIGFGYKPYNEIKLPLIGSYQPYNTALAITALEILRDKGYKIGDDDIVNGLESVSWPGRFEVLGIGPVFILDGSHNPQGMEATAKSLLYHFSEKSDRFCQGESGCPGIIFIVGVMADKDVDAMTAYIAPLAKHFFTVKPRHVRAMCSHELAEKLKHFGIPVTDSGSVANGVSEALSMAGERDIICALGSFYMSAEVREIYMILRP